MQRDTKAIRIARFTEQGARLVQIIARRRHIGRAVRNGGGRELFRRHALAHEQTVHNALAIDGKGKSAAHPRITQGVTFKNAALLVGHEGRWITRCIGEKIGSPIAGHAKNRKPGIIGKALHILHRHEINQIHIARKQCGHTRAGIADEARYHPFPGLRFPPIGRVACDLMPFALRVADMAIGAGADHGAACIEIAQCRIGMQVAGQDHDVGKVPIQEGVGFFGPDHDAARFRDFDGGDAAHKGREGAGAIGNGGHARIGKGDILSGQGRAVVEFNALAQLEFPGQVINGAPGFGQPRHQPARSVEIHQSFKNLPQNGVIGVGGMVMRVHPRWCALRADGEGALRLRGRRAQQQRAGRQHQRSEKSHRHTPKGL